jgi:hypothetical protein
MDLISRIFKSRKKISIDILIASIGVLCAGVFSRLCKKYVPMYGTQKGELLSSAIINYALIQPPANRNAELYLGENSDLIIQEAMQLKSDPELVSAFSYLYAAQTLHLVHQTKEILSSHAIELGQRAASLSLYIPNNYDICGSDDANKCIAAIWKYSKEFSHE